MVPNRLRPLLLTLLAAVPLAPSAPAQEQEPPPYEETIEVREVEVLFDAGVLPRFESLGKKELADFTAMENGTALSLLSLGEIPAEDWTHVLYFDEALAGPKARAAAVAALIDRAAAFADGALVEVVVADPRPRSVISTRDPEELRRALGQVGGAARGGKSGKSDEDRSVAVRSLALDRLAAGIAARGGGGARALWLPVDAWPLSPAELERFTRARQADDLSEPLLRALASTGRVLAGYGWVTFPLAITTEEPAPPSDASRGMRVEQGGTGDERVSAPIITMSGSRSQPKASEEKQLDTLLDFGLAPLSELSRATSGTLVGQGERLRTALANLERRRRATYRGPRPEPGALVPLEVRWTGGDGRPLPAPKFLRSGSPPEATAARLRSLLAGDAAPKGEGITLRETGAAGAALREVCFSGEKRPVRISVAREKANGDLDLAIREPRELEGTGDAACVPLAADLASGDRRLAWVAEDLDSDTWTGGVEVASSR